MASPTRGPTGTNLAQLAAVEPVGDTRGWIRNLATEEDLNFWFRPDQVRESIRANYGELSVLGMSHSYQTYENTTNVSITFDLYVNRLMLVKRGASQVDAQNRTREGNPEAGLTDLRGYSDLMEQDRRYLQALLYSPATELGAIGASPPACILALPGVCTIRARLQTLDITHNDVDLEGNTKEYRARVTFDEAPMSRITMEDVRENGLFRVWGEL